VVVLVCSISSTRAKRHSTLEQESIKGGGSWVTVVSGSVLYFLQCKIIRPVTNLIVIEFAWRLSLFTKDVFQHIGGG
jgi:hypothetical protein